MKGHVRIDIHAYPKDICIRGDQWFGSKIDIFTRISSTKEDIVYHD